MDAITLSRVSKAYDHPVLKAVSLQVPRGGTVGLMGPSGCGKTTLLRLIAGLEKPDSGALTTAPGLKIGFVFQEDRLLPAKTVRENLRFVMKKPDEGLIDDLLLKMRLSDAADKTPDELSGGMRRRAAIARAFVSGADIILMDEPFNGLDAALIREIAGLIREISALRGITVLAVSHKREELELLGADIVEGLFN